MKISCSKVSDLEERRRLYDEESARYDSIYEDQHAQYTKADRTMRTELKEAVEKLIGETSLYLSIEVYGDWDSYQVIIRNDGKGDSTSLRWDWKVKLDQSGKVIKNSGSWSGLQAVTSEQIADLKESVRVIEKLNDVDWEDLLTKFHSVDYTEFIDEDNASMAVARKHNRPDFEQEIAIATLEEYLGSNTYIRTKGAIKPGYRDTSSGWVKLVGETDKYFDVEYSADFYMDRFESGEADTLSYTTERVKKSELVKVTNALRGSLETKEV